jgi:hypothetical protein
VQAVGTEQVAVSGHWMYVSDFDVDFVTHTQGPKNLISAGISFGFFLVEHPFAQQRSHERMIFGDRREGFAAKSVESTIADMGHDRGTIVDQEKADDRRAHPVQGTVFASGCEDLLIRRFDRCL